VETLLHKTILYLKGLEQKICVLSTVNPDHTPESAVMGYAIREDGNIIFNTNRNSRKWSNIAVNQSVSICVGWDMRVPFIQIEGVAVKIENGTNYTTNEEFYFSCHPNSLAYKGNPDTVFISVRPLWIRFSNMSITPYSIEECRLI
jgi:general stress protein 26